MTESAARSRLIRAVSLMCQQCYILQTRIDQFRRLLAQRLDALTEERLRAGVADMEAKKSALHPESSVARRRGRPPVNSNKSSGPAVSSIMTEQWTEKLVCPHCGTTGSAILSQEEDGDPPTVVSVDKFIVTGSPKGGPIFYCANCDAPAKP